MRPAGDDPCPGVWVRRLEYRFGIVGEDVGHEVDRSTVDELLHVAPLSR
jgi:hypothetical protein